VTERLLTARQLGDLLGFAAGTVVDWAEAGTVPCFKVGGRLRFRQSEVLEWLETRRMNGPGAGGERVTDPLPLTRPEAYSLRCHRPPHGGGTDA
jgi:excisionase family DNA binding protein